FWRRRPRRRPGWNSWPSAGKRRPPRLCKRSCWKGGGKVLAVVPMQRMELWALRDRQKPLLELLQLRGAVEVRPASQAEGMFSREDTSQLCREAEQAAQTLETAAQLLEPYAPGKK